VNHRSNQNKNQNKGGGTEGNGGKTVWLGVLTGLGYSDGWKVGNAPGAILAQTGTPQTVNVSLVSFTGMSRSLYLGKFLAFQNPSTSFISTV
jgi:hypothetical protein